jgi:orotidine-5'-phosphate decarboxylase
MLWSTMEPKLEKKTETSDHSTMTAPASVAGDSFFAKLERRVAACNSLLCVGIEPRCMPERLYSNCETLIRETHQYAAAFKVNLSFFFNFGPEGLAVLKRVVDLIPKDIPTIIDGKFGDIGNTCQVEQLL